MKNILLLILGLLFPICAIFAQSQEQAYYKAVDRINCEASRLILKGFDRPAAARSIQTCRYTEILTQINGIQENKVTGYKARIAEMATGINDYKGRVSSDSGYRQIEETLIDLKEYTLEQFRSICQDYKHPDNKICQNLDQKVLTLESTINSITNNALSNLTNDTVGGTAQNEVASKPVADDEEEGGLFSRFKKKETPTATVDPSLTRRNTTTNSGSSAVVGDSSNSLFMTIILVLLILAVGWLFKENYELKQQVEDLKVLLKTFTQRR